MSKLMNKHVENTKDQVYNTLEFLSKLGLLRIYKPLHHEKDNTVETLTWENHISGRHNAGKSFTTLNQYVTIYESGAYHGVLFDGSIIRVYYKFNKNRITHQSLLYWPSPINIPEQDVDELGIREALNLYLSEIDVENTKLLMRTPVRFDYDSENDSSEHPGTHIHMQHPDCRISSRSPICFNTFIAFIFNNFYPDIKIQDWSNLEKLNYSGYKDNNRAVINL